MNVNDLDRLLKCSTILSIKRADADEGLALKLLTLNNQVAFLEIGYSGGMGTTTLNCTDEVVFDED